MLDVFFSSPVVFNPTASVGAWMLIAVDKENIDN